MGISNMVQKETIMSRLNVLMSITVLGVFVLANCQSQAAMSCSDIGDYSISTTVQPSISGNGRFNFGESYKDVVSLSNGVQLDIAYQSTFMQVNEQQDVFHYGLRADPSEIDQARFFASCYAEQKPDIQADNVILDQEPASDIILLRFTQDEAILVDSYKVSGE
jgi:hypothetical protein